MSARESIQEEANRRGVSVWQVRKDRGESAAGEGRVQAVFRIPEELHARLQAEAEDRDLSMNYLGTRAIEEFLDRLIPTEEFRLTRPPVTAGSPVPPESGDWEMG